MQTCLNENFWQGRIIRANFKTSEMIARSRAVTQNGDFCSFHRRAACFTNVRSLPRTLNANSHFGKSIQFEKIHKALNKPEKCPLNHLGKMTSQALPDRLEMLPAADDKSVWDIGPRWIIQRGFLYLRVGW